MTIEFRCQGCNKLLRTSDDRAGARAKCPDCGATVMVPQAAGADDEFDYGDIEEDDARDADRYGAAYTPERQDRYGDSDYADDTKNCPMCGAEIRAAAVKCRFCGEMLDAPPGRGGGGEGDGHPTQFEAGEVISTSWEIFKSEMGLLIGGMLVFGLITIAISFVLQAIQTGIIGGAGMGRRQPNLGVVLFAVFFSTILSVLVNSFFQAGWSLFLVNVARGKNPEIGNLFGGGPYYLRVLGNSLLFIIMIYIGFVMCIIPGIILALMFWPFQYVIVDENAPHQNALSRAKELTDGNWGAVFVLALATVGINILGLLACGIGLLFTVPLTSLMMGVAYCRMAGRRTALER